MSHSKTRDLFLKFGPEIPNLAKKAGVKLLAGSLVNAEHIITTVVKADEVEAVNQFLAESKLERFNSVRIIPSLPLKEGLEPLAKEHPIFEANFARVRYANRSRAVRPCYRRDRTRSGFYVLTEPHPQVHAPFRQNAKKVQSWICGDGSQL